MPVLHAQARGRGSGFAVGIELAGAGTAAARRGAGLALRHARDTDLGAGSGWRLLLAGAATTATPPEGRVWGSYLFGGAAVGAQSPSHGPYFRLGGGMLNTVAYGTRGSPNQVGYDVAGYGALGVELPVGSTRPFLELSAIVPTSARFGRGYVAIHAGARLRAVAK